MLHRVRLHTSVRLTGPLSVVTGPLADHAEAVLREALSNVVHHAHAHQVEVTVSVDDDLTLCVTDDGTGIPATVTRSGLHNLTTCAEQAGGTCTLTTPHHRRNPTDLDRPPPRRVRSTLRWGVHCR